MLDDVSSGKSLGISEEESLPPPSIVELSTSHAVLSWRTLRGSSFYCTEEVTKAVDSEKCLSLEGGTTCSKTYHDDNNEASEKASRSTSFLKVDHVELQTCDCTCLQCLLGEQSTHTIDGPFTPGCSCTFCVPVRGEIVACWRQVYGGPESRCEVKLEPGNALHHFRLIVRTRPAASEKRGSQRAKTRSGLPGKHDAPRTEGKKEGVGQGKTLRRQQTGDNETTEHANGVGKASASVVFASSKGSSRGRDVIPRGMSAPHKYPKARWFVSASVHIVSCPPVITLHGIDRALVLTWPAIARFSGLERISYLVEQWSRPAGMPTTPDDLLATPNSLPKNNSKSTPLQVPSRPLPSDKKEAFLVGKRCWFVPVSLKAARKYWYRLRIVHERGSSVGGPWVSHITSSGALTCTDVDAGGLALSFPCAIGRSVTVPLLENRAKGKRGVGSGEIIEIEERSKGSSAKKKESELDVNGEQHQVQGQGTVRNEEPNAEGKGGCEDLGLQQETLAVSYTLEGLKAGSRWIVLYHGGSTDVIVKGLQANTLNNFRVSINVDMTELRRRALGALSSLELEQPKPLVPEADLDIISTVSNPPSHSRLTRGSSHPNEKIIRPALRSQNAAACADFYSVTSSTSSDVSRHMRQEGFTVYDATATIVGGFYSEPLVASSLLSQPSLEVSENGMVDTTGRRPGSSINGQGVITTREGGMHRQYLELATATAPLPPRYAAFVVDGVQKVKLWWAGARSSTEGFETQTANDSDPAMPTAGASRPYVTTDDTQPSMAKKTGLVGGSSALRLLQQSPSFALGILDREAGNVRTVYSGPRQWADLGRSAVRGIPLAPGTAYFVRFSARTTLAYPKGRIDSVVITAPPAPILEPVVTKGQGSAGATMVKVLWKTTIDTRFIPAEESPPPFSVAVEMAHSWEVASPSRGAGGAIRQTFRTSSGHAALVAAQKYGLPQKSMDRKRTDPAGSDRAAVRTDSSGGQCWTLDSSSWKTLGDTVGRFRVVWRGSSRDDEAFSPCMPPGMRFAFRIRIDSPFGVAVSAATVYQTASIVPLAPKGLRAFLVIHESSRPKKKRQCVLLSWEPSDPGHGKNVITSFTVEVRHPRRRMQQNGDEIWHPWRQVCSCSDTTCLDPSTLGVSRIFADYRVRAQGPGGVGPWSELLRVDTLAKTLRRSNSARSKDENDVSDGRGRSGSGNGNDPGTRNRDPREELGHLPRTTSQRTQLNINMSPPSSTVSALLSPAAEAAAAASMVASEHLYKRAGGSKKLLWGTLANPRSTHRRHDVAAAAELEAMTGNEIYGWFPPALCGLDAAEDKIVSGSEGAEGCVGLSSREIEEAGSSCTAVGTVVSGGTDEVPPEVALMVRKQADLSIGFIGPGGVSSARLGSKQRRLRRNPGLPVVIWNTPLPIPCGSERGEGEDHKTTVATPRSLSELTISAPLRQSSGGDQRLRRKKNGLRSTIIVRRHTYSHKRSSVKKAMLTGVSHSSPCLQRGEGPPRSRGDVESPHASFRTVVSGGTTDDPPEVALMLRKQVDLPSSFIDPGGVSSTGLGSNDRGDDAVSGVEGLLRRNPGLPVVTWNTPFAIPCGNESDGGENHKTTVVATPQNLSEITIPALMKQSSEENQRLHERRTTDDCGDSTRVSISRREDNGEQEHLRPTIIRTQTCSHGRSSIEAAMLTGVHHSSPCLLRKEGLPQSRSHAESPHASSRKIEVAESSRIAVETVLSGDKTEIPPEVALIMRKQVDLSSSFIGAGGVSPARDNAVSGVEGNETSGGEELQSVSEITIPVLMQQSSEENQRLYGRRTTGDSSTRVSTSRWEDDKEQERLRPIIRTHTISQGRSSTQTALLTGVNHYSSSCLQREEGATQSRGDAESPLAQAKQEIDACKTTFGRQIEQREACEREHGVHPQPLQQSIVPKANSEGGTGAVNAERTGSLAPKGANESLEKDEEEEEGKDKNDGGEEEENGENSEEEEGEDEEDEEGEDEEGEDEEEEEDEEDEEEEEEENEEEEGEDEEDEDEEDEDEEGEDEEDEEGEDEDEEGEDEDEEGEDEDEEGEEEEDEEEEDEEEEEEDEEAR